MNLIGDTIEHSIKTMPKTNPVSVSGYHIRESGATSAQEMAYGILIANAYIDNVLKRGYEVDQFVGSFSFNFNIFGNLWETVAKYRAGRKLWARNLKEKYGVKTTAEYVHARHVWRRGGGLTKEEPENNIMRGAFYGIGRCPCRRPNNRSLQL